MDKQNFEERRGEERPSSEQMWQSLRDQFAGKQQSINEFQAADLIEQWLMAQHQEDIQTLQKRLEKHPDRIKPLRQVIEEVLNSEKQHNWIIRQRYNYEHAVLFTEKVKEMYERLIENRQDRKDDTEEEVKKQETVYKVENQGRQIKEISVIETGLDSNTSNRSSKLPEIKPRGKLFSPEQMASTFHLREEVIQQYQPRSPHLFSKQAKAKNPLTDTLFGNKYLKMAFERFCKQSYGQRGLFSDFFKQADKMNLNKWMVFCKEFQFNEKFHIKHLIEIYQQGAQFGSTMDVNQFLTAVGLLQQKYIDKFHTGEKFVEDVLKINSEASFRVKMENLKVRYGGPMRNSFEQATYHEHLRLEQIQREKQFKTKKKERDIVLIKGMYEDHLKAEVQRLRQQREKNKLSRSNIGMNRSLMQEKKPYLNEEKNTHRITKSSRPDSLNYSKIFQIKSPSPRKTANVESKAPENSPLYMTEHQKISQKRAINPQTSQLPVKLKNPPQTDRQNDSPQREWFPEPQGSTWLTRLRSDSEESDQILKQHLQIQKKIQKNRESLRVKHLMKEVNERSSKVDQMLKQMQEDEDLMETGANFKPKSKDEIFH